MKKDLLKCFWRTLVPHHGRQQNFFRGGENDILLIRYQVADDCNANWRAQNAFPFLRHKENVSVTATVANSVSSKKIDSE